MKEKIIPILKGVGKAIGKEVLKNFLFYGSMAAAIEGSYVAAVVMVIAAFYFKLDEIHDALTHDAIKASREEHF